MSKHTPGPWEVAEENGDYFVQVASQPSACHPMFDRYRIIHGWVGGDGTDSPNPELGTPIANARLIAAAPELLEALMQMVERISYYAELKEEGIPNIEDWAYTYNSGDMQRARAAIAKAIGGDA